MVISINVVHDVVRVLCKWRKMKESFYKMVLCKEIN